jgi:iron complex outermembrane receptor protein
MLRYCFATVFVVLYCMQSNAQDSCTLSVQFLVTEAHNAVPVPDVLLYLAESKMNVQTDENGIAVLEQLCPGTYTIHIHSYETEDTTQTLIVNKSGLYRLEVRHSDKVLHQIVVRSRHENTILQNKDQLSAITMQKNTGETISEMLKNVTGVSTLSNGATISKPVIHGLHSNRILILNNGIRQEDQQWGSEHAPNIDPFVAGNITVLKGAAGVRYGTDAIGGVLLVEPSPIRSDAGWGGELNLAAFSNNRMGVASIMAEHRFTRHPEFSFRLQTSAKQGGNYSIPGNIRVANSGIRERNFSATFNYRGVHSGAEFFFSHFGNTVGVYSGSHTGSRQDLERAIKSPVPLVPATFTYDIGRPRQQVNHELAKVKAYLENKWGVWNLVYAFQHNFRQEYDVMRVDNGKPQLNLTLNTQSINLNLDHKKTGLFSGQIGIDAQYQHNSFKDGDRVFIPSYYSFGAALYLIERYVRNSWTFEGGARYDYKHFDLYNPEGVRLQNVRYQFDYSNPSATLAVKNKLNPHWEWSATLANAWRAPQAPELFSAGLHQGGARIELGNKALVPEKSFSLNLASTYEIENKLKFDVSLYGQNIKDFIYLRPGAEVLTIRGYYKTFNYVQTDALLYGTDISATYSWNKHLSTDVKAAMLRARDLVQKGWLILMPSDRFSAGAKYAFSINKQVTDCYLELNTDYVLQQTRIPANFDEIDAPRPPAAYFLLQAEAGMHIVCRKQSVNCSITASNLLNTKYRDYMDIFRYFIDQPGTNVALRLRVPFN